MNGPVRFCIFPTTVRYNMNSLQKQDVLVVHLSNSLFDPVVEGYHPRVLGVSGLVERVVSSHPRVVLVMLRVTSEGRGE